MPCLWDLVNMTTRTSGIAVAKQCSQTSDYIVYQQKLLSYVEVYLYLVGGGEREKEREGGG